MIFKRSILHFQKVYPSFSSLQTLISRLPADKKAGKFCVVQSDSISLTKTSFSEPAENGDQQVIVDTEGIVEVS